jgi:D-sedoheptulose 7-phosphate isomerase
MSHAVQFLSEAKQVIDGFDTEAIERMATLLDQAREQDGRLFILGVGGSAGNASHAVNDFRKMVGIEAYAPTDNVSELTARTNDEDWSTVFVEWLRVSHLKSEDLILVLSVGGGSREKNVSPNLVAALQYAQEIGTPVIGIVGNDGATRPRLPRLARSCRRSTPGTSRPIPKPSRRSSGTCWSHTHY